MITVSAVARFGTGALILSCIVAALGVAQTPERPATRPAAPLVPDSADRGYAAYRALHLADAMAAERVVGARYEVLIASPGAAYGLRLSTDRAAAVDRCRDRFELAAQQAADLRTLDPWKAFDEAITEVPLIVITVVPSLARPVDCARTPGELHALLAMGLRFARDTLSHASNDAGAVDLTIGGRRVEPAMVGRATIVKVSPAGLIAPDGTHMIRLHLAFGAIAPADDGTFPPAELRVWNLIDRRPQIITIDQGILRRLWAEYTEWRRFRATSVATARVDFAPLTPAPSPAPSGHMLEVSEADRGYSDFAIAEFTAGTAPKVLQQPLGARHLAILPLAAQFRASADPSLHRSLYACAAAFGLSPGAAAQLAARTSWSALDSAAAAVPTVAFTVSPVPPSPCETASDAGSVAVVGRIQFTHQRDSIGAVGVAEAEILVNGSPVAPALMGRVRTLRVGSNGVVRNGADQLKLFLPAEAFEPTADGARPQVAIRIRDVDGLLTAPVELAPAIVDSIWSASLQWRAARLRSRSGRDGFLPLSLPTPRDRVLGISRAQYRSGDLGAASAEALARLRRSESLREADALSGWMQLGASHLEGGDEVAAREHFAAALAIEPCLFLPVNTSPDASRLMDRVRPPRRCEARSLAQVVRAGLLPGGAQFTQATGGRAIGALLLAATVWQLSSAASNRVRAHALYEDYRSEIIDPVSVYRSAEAHRQMANRQFVTTAALWAGGIVLGMISERSYGAHLAERRDFGARPTRTFGPVDGGR